MIFAPTMLPTERELCFLTIAEIVVTSSGSEVPTATIVRETILSSICRMSVAMTVPLSTKRREPMTSPAAPRMKKIMFLMTVFLSLETAAAVSCPSPACFFAS